MPIHRGNNRSCSCISSTGRRAQLFHFALGLLVGILGSNFFQGASLFPVTDMDAYRQSVLLGKDGREQETTMTTSQQSKITISNTGGAVVDSSSPLLQRQQQQRNFLEIARQSGTDKVKGTLFLPSCLENPQTCRKPKAKNPKCRVGAQHFYDTVYQKWLGPYSTDTVEPFQFLEIGYFNGKGFDAYADFMPRAELHSMEISCLPPGKQSEGKWPWGNFAARNVHYQALRDARRLHCGDAADHAFLRGVWTTHMKRRGAPPLRVVVDDGSHLAQHMATTLFFWFPRIEPGGILVIEDIEPLPEAASFRTGVVPQLLLDLHYCGNDEHFAETVCFPTIQPLLHAVHCEMHICVLERNQEPAVDTLSEQDSMPPPHALDAMKCLQRKL